MVSLAEMQDLLRDGPIILRLSSLVHPTSSRKRSLKGKQQLNFNFLHRLAIDLGVPVISMNQIILNVIE
jgi:hypothetical protein